MTDMNLLRILFVEDLPSDVDLAVLELRKEKLKFEHITICTRVDLIKALKEFKPDLIISDYMMPAYNGLQALRDVKKFDKSIPFILYTGSTNEETAIECIKAGADDYVIKEHMTRLPFAVKEALEQVRIKKEKRAADLLLKESEAKLQSIFSATPAGIGLVINRIYVEVNDTFCRMTGYSRNEIIGKSSAMMYPAIEEFEIVGVEKYEQIARKGIGSVETRLKCKDGRILNIISTSTPLDPKDLSKGVTFTVLDITERKQAETAVLKSEERFRTLYNDAVVGLYRTNSQGKILLANHALVKMLGFQSFNELAAINLNRSGVGTAYQRQKFIDQIEKEGEVKDLEAIWICRDGKEIFVRENAKLIRDPEGKILYYDGTVEDITMRKILEAATIASEQRYRELFLNNPVPIYIFDENTLEFIEVNDATVQNYGYSREDFASMTLKDIRLPEDIPDLLESITKLGKDSFHSTSMRHRRKDGTVFPVEITSHYLPEKNGRKTRLVMTIDITERLKAAEQMKLAKEKAEASDKLKTTFLNNISHEVRTPLNGILGFAEIMSQSDLSEEEKKDSINASRMLRPPAEYDYQLYGYLTDNIRKYVC